MPDLPVTSADIKLLVPSTTLDDAALDAFGVSADALVQSLLINQGLSSELMFEIERFLGAHITSMADPSGTTPKAMKRVGELETEYANARATTAIGLGLNYTRFGQIAMTLDITGRLRRANAQGKMHFSVTHSNQFNGDNIGDPDIAVINRG